MIRKLLETYLPFFSSLDAGDQEELCFRSFTQCFGKGELIASPDVMCDNIIFVIDGRLKSVLRQERHSILLYYLNPDDICILGSSPLLYGTAAKINIIADMDSRILKVPAQTFNEMKDRYPGMSHFLRRNFMDRFADILYIIKDRTQSTPRQLVASYLYDLASYFPDSIIDVTQSKISEETAVSRSQVSTITAQLEKEGILQSNHGRIKIIDAGKLASI